MSTFVLSLLAFTGGLFLALQGGLNAQLGVLLKHPLLASVVAFCCSACYALMLTAVSVKSLPAKAELMQVPPYLWFTGGLCSVTGIALYYYTIPRLGISTMISLGLCGQLIFSLIAGHYGWFELPMQPIHYKKILGAVIMIAGIILINSK